MLFTSFMLSAVERNWTTDVFCYLRTGFYGQRKIGCGVFYFILLLDLLLKVMITVLWWLTFLVSIPGHGSWNAVIVFDKWQSKTKCRCLSFTRFCHHLIPIPELNKQPAFLLDFKKKILFGVASINLHNFSCVVFQSIKKCCHSLAKRWPSMC